MISKKKNTVNEKMSIGLLKVSGKKIYSEWTVWKTIYL